MVIITSVIDYISILVIWTVLPSPNELVYYMSVKSFQMGPEFFTLILIHELRLFSPDSFSDATS